MFVESHDRFDDVADFDPESGHLDRFSRSAPGEHGHLLAGVVQGHFAQLGDKRAVLYRHGGELWLRLGERAANLDAPATEVRRVRIGETTRLVLLHGGTETASVDYLPGPHNGPPVADDPTAFAESEDWDFGLFVCNVLSDPGRRRRIYSPGSLA